MPKHGKGPKDVLVKSYPRWKAGKREWVRSALRASWHRLSLKDSKDQLIFGFCRSATG
jgi:hypothetical protein